MDTKEKRVSGKPRTAAASSGGGSGAKTGASGKTRRTPSKAAEGKLAGAAAKKKKPARRRSDTQSNQDVVYVQPSPFNKGRFILSLVIVVAVVMAIALGLAIFFKVDGKMIFVSGVDKYTEAQVIEASGIKHADNLFSVSAARVSSNIIAKLPYISRVRVGIKLPDTVKIEVEELEVVYSVADSAGNWWLVSSDGRVVEKTNSADALQHTQITGVEIRETSVGEIAEAWQPAAEEIDGETVPVTVYASEKLSVALSIVQYLEDCGIIGELTSIDVTNLGDIQMKYGEKYKILLGNSLELYYKIQVLSGILKEGTQESGVLDISFTVWPDEVGHRPFS